MHATNFTNYMLSCQDFMDIKFFNKRLGDVISPILLRHTFRASAYKNDRTNPLIVFAQQLPVCRQSGVFVRRLSGINLSKKVFKASNLLKFTVFLIGIGS